MWTWRLGYQSWSLILLLDEYSCNRLVRLFIHYWMVCQNTGMVCSKALGEWNACSTKMNQLTHFSLKQNVQNLASDIFKYVNGIIFLIWFLSWHMFVPRVPTGHKTAWAKLAPNINQCWHRFMSLYGSPRPACVSTRLAFWCRKTGTPLGLSMAWCQICDINQ